MIVSDILEFARGTLDDEKLPYLWSDKYLLNCYNRSVDDVCRRVKHIRDSSTASICEIDILSGLALYSYSAKIVEIISAKLSGQTSPLAKKSERWMDQNYPGSWKESEGTPTIIIPEFERDKLRLYPYFEDTYVVEGNSNISFTAGTKTISKPTGGLSVFEEDDEISISGTVSNGTDAVPVIVTVVTVSDTAIVVSETVATEAGTSAVLRRVEDTLNLSVARLPLTWVTLADLTGSPPIDDDYHLDMIHGICSYAYLKDGTETYDPKQAMRHKGLFEEMIEKTKRDHRDKTYFEQTCGPARGAI
jgi:hypothetical protein